MKGGKVSFVLEVGVLKISFLFLIGKGGVAIHLIFCDDAVVWPKWFVKYTCGCSWHDQRLTRNCL
jgi:hypothetical protein